MGRTLRILIVEDSEDDTLLLVRELKRGEYDITYERVETAADFLAQLDNHQWDIIISDYSMPKFSALTALQMMQEKGLDLPFLILSGAIGEETAVEALKAGAHDFFVKGNTARLIPAIDRELREARERRKRHEAERALREGEEQLRLAINAAQLGTWNWDIRADKITYGGHYEHLFGLTSATFDSNLEGFMDLVFLEDRHIVQEALRRSFEGEPYQTEFRIVRPDGEIRWIVGRGQVYWDEAGEPVTMNGIVQDITERKYNEELLLRQALELQTRNEELDAFAYTVAHDLKNPIASMMGFASLVQSYYDRMSDDAILEYINLIMEGGQKLKEIINALLLLAGVNKKENIDQEPLDMAQIVDAAKQRLNALINETNAQIFMPSEWPTAVGYTPWVEEIWANYISNALKYGGRPPLVEVGAEQQPDNMVRFWVRDNGNGLTPEEQARLFTPFTRLNQIKVEGHGLGLSIVQRIVHRLGGEVNVHSRVNEGCVFSFTLPSAMYFENGVGK